MRNLLLLAVFGLVAFSCASQTTAPLLSAEKPRVPADELRRGQMLGKWVGETVSKDGTQVKWLMERKVNGSFVARFKVIDTKGQAREQAEAGFWGVAGNIYFTMTRVFLEAGRLVPADVTSANLYDAYEIKNFSPTELSYKSFSTRELFSVRKVSDSYAF